ncbi:hypothetical protein KSP35_23030 [Aquihabitans sp. G128]|uniref:hypothetical protein n=1 Tax=Aquihabitans sp. G128 TaxID=2849779 RepID=UPI001C219412|nr:hypothetical protein [Aquihabitans sp. G128]QXC61148.1 hypothetical protein KSP35_23030 [Aquihabitans sp. G128]
MTATRRPDLTAASRFLATHGRLLDRARFAALLPQEDRRAAGHRILAALDGHRNPDGGYGLGLEPDLRAVESQPAGALHAFEALADAAEAGAPLPRGPVDGLLAWLGANALEGGPVPFALPIAEPAGCSPFWVEADPTEPSLQLTAPTVAHAHRLLTATGDAVLAADPWLADATAWCLAAIDEAASGDEAPFAYVVQFSLLLLDAVAEREPAAADLVARLGRHVPDGPLPVVGGIEGEVLHPIELAPRPGAPSRSLYSAATIDAELDRLVDEQRPDGGWTVAFRTNSPAAALEWRGFATVGAVAKLLAGGR